MDTDYYKVLGVDRTATESEIKKQYRKLSMSCHPDRERDASQRDAATQKFQKISEAYEVLGDSAKRQQYDLQQLNPFRNGIPGMPGMPSMPKMPGMSGVPGIPGMPIPPELFELFSSGLFGGEMPQVFHMSSGGPVPMHTSQESAPEPIEKNLEISLEEAFTGKTKQISVSRTIMRRGTRNIETETLYISVPAGIDNDEIITIKNKGNVVNNMRGDVKVVIRVKNFTKFSRQGIDLIYNKEITLKESLCGFDFDMEYIDGRVFKIKNESGNIISSGYKKIIPKMGMAREKVKGDLIIKFSVLFPKNLDQKKIDLLKTIL
tara:strand:- start:540 stop:1496 length:957 start_codon:yes stop_codon:yes gene_type:complete